MSAVKVSWKNEQSPVKDPAILAFQRSSSETSTGKGSAQGNSSTNNNTRLSISRELGVVEKLLSSYGFLQCANRQGRLFFHFSEVASDADSLKVGDLVEFQQSSDRRTGKPIAVSILRVPNGSLVTYEIISEKTVTGTVLAEAKASKNRGSEGEAPSLLDGMGRVTYEQSGETFFLPFALEDIEGGQKIQAGDTVEFYISTDERNGNIRARQVRKIRPTSSDLFQGVVCSLKDNYGFIERADVVKEIFFHFSEFQGDIEALNLGDDVEFNIQIRNNKEVAVNIQQLPEGTVVFEDVGMERKRGKILKTLKSIHGRMQSDPLAGRIVYETLKGSIEIPYGDRDQLDDYTLQVGDIVEFCIATDRRDQLQRATNICLVDVTFTVSGEKRERGFVTTLKDAFGFIRCLDRDARMFFHYSEILNQIEPQLQDEVEFTIVQDPPNQNRMVAIRIKVLPKGTISVEQCLPEKFTGIVEKEASKTGGKGGDSDIGIIMYAVSGTKQTIPYSAKPLNDGYCQKHGDQMVIEAMNNSSSNNNNLDGMDLGAIGGDVDERPSLKRHSPWDQPYEPVVKRGRFEDNTVPIYSARRTPSSSRVTPQSTTSRTGTNHQSQGRQRHLPPETDDWDCRICDKPNRSTRGTCWSCKEYRYVLGIAPPSTWSIDSGRSLLITLHLIDNEYGMVRELSRALWTDFLMVRMQRVQNLGTFQKYQVEKEQLREKLKNKINERYLFHGCTYDAMRKIIKTFFNRSLCGSNAGISYGQCSYFAKCPLYSANPMFSSPKKNGHQSIIIARVLLGRSTVGSQGMQVPPDGYHSTVDNIEDPTVFCTFSDYQAMPVYVLTIKKRN